MNALHAPSIDPNDTIAVLRGDWVAAYAGEMERVLACQSTKGPVDLTHIARLDTTGAFLIQQAFDIHTDTLSETQSKLFALVQGTACAVPQDDQKQTAFTAIAGFGKTIAAFCTQLYSLIAFLGRVLVALVACITTPKKFRFAETVRHIGETGISALPIIALLAFFMSMIVSYQGALQLQKFGADIYTVDLTLISLLREMGVLVTAIMVAGRSGSAFAAEIGVMKLRKEVDALSTIGVDPVTILVLPRLIAVMITLPLLTFFANCVGVAGASLTANLLLDIPFTLYFDRASQVVKPSLIFVGLIKAPVFALLIGVICTFQGMSVSGSAESVGRLTTVAVVQSIFVVILCNAVFSIVFAWAGI